MNLKFDTALGMLHAKVTPTIHLLSDPWLVKIRSTKGDLLLSCFVDEPDPVSAAETAILEVLRITKTHNKTIRIQ